MLASGGLVMLAIAAAWGASAWYANRDVPATSLAEHQRSFQKSVAWLQAHESEVLQDGNVALWWMLQTAAQLSQDPYLNSLVARSVEHVYQGSRATSPWRRVLDPTAPYMANPLLLDGLELYQRFYYHAATCEQPDDDDQGRAVKRYFTDNTCRPMLSRVLLSDTVCSTHQFLGLSIYKRARCQGSDKVDPLQHHLLQDIAQQLRLDPVFRDPYIQRVLVLSWFGDPKQVKPVWHRTVLDAQLADGGWNGERQFPGAPSWLQPLTWRSLMKGDVSGALKPAPLVSGFHATAQGVLLQALAVKQMGGSPAVAQVTP